MGLTEPCSCIIIPYGNTMKKICPDPPLKNSYRRSGFDLRDFDVEKFAAAARFQGQWADPRDFLRNEFKQRQYDDRHLFRHGVVRVGHTVLRRTTPATPFVPARTPPVHAVHMPLSVEEHERDENKWKMEQVVSPPDSGPALPKPTPRPALHHVMPTVSPFENVRSPLWSAGQAQQNQVKQNQPINQFAQNNRHVTAENQVSAPAFLPNAPMTQNFLAPDTDQLYPEDAGNKALPNPQLSNAKHSSPERNNLESVRTSDDEIPTTEAKITQQTSSETSESNSEKSESETQPLLTLLEQNLEEPNELNNYGVSNASVLLPQDVLASLFQNLQEETAEAPVSGATGATNEQTEPEAEPEDSAEGSGEQTSNTEPDGVFSQESALPANPLLALPTFLPALTDYPWPHQPVPVGGGEQTQNLVPSEQAAGGAEPLSPPTWNRTMRLQFQKSATAEPQEITAKADSEPVRKAQQNWKPIVIHTSSGRLVRFDPRYMDLSALMKFFNHNATGRLNTQPEGEVQLQYANSGVMQIRKAIPFFTDRDVGKIGDIRRKQLQTIFIRIVQRFVSSWVTDVRQVIPVNLGFSLFPRPVHPLQQQVQNHR